MSSGEDKLAVFQKKRCALQATLPRLEQTVHSDTSSCIRAPLEPFPSVGKCPCEPDRRIPEVDTGSAGSMQLHFRKGRKISQSLDLH